jgi:hypothetical protein
MVLSSELSDKEYERPRTWRRTIGGSLLLDDESFTVELTLVAVVVWLDRRLERDLSDGSLDLVL